MQAVIFHGWGADSSSNWFPWLKTELENKGFDVRLPDLPNSQNPAQEEWIKAALDLTKYDEKTVLIGHSLGTILIMRLLEKGIKVKASFLVAGFDEHLGIPELKNFFENDFDYQKIKKNKIHMLSSDDDPYIKIEIAKRLAHNLGCDLRIFQNKEHLSAGTIDFTFPELYKMILNA